MTLLTAIVLWCAVSVAVAVVVGRALRFACSGSLTPVSQLAGRSEDIEVELAPAAERCAAPCGAPEAPGCNPPPQRVTQPLSEALSREPAINPG